MASQPPPASPLFLREAEIRRGFELLFFGSSALSASADELLNEHGLGRAHHRALYFIARKPGLAVSDLTSLLGITKQSLGRVLADLDERNMIERRKGKDDRRQVLLSLTRSGERVEAQLFSTVKDKIIEAYSEAGPAAVGGFWTVLEKLLSPDALDRVSRLSRPTD